MYNVENSLDPESVNEARGGPSFLAIQNKSPQQLGSGPEYSRPGFESRLLTSYMILGKLFTFSKPQVLKF